MRVFPTRALALLALCLVAWLATACSNPGTSQPAEEVHFPDPSSATGPYLLVHFTADWCPACQAFKPALARFEAENLDKFRPLHIDVDKREAPDFEKHIVLLQEGSKGAIPYTVLLDEKGMKVADWVGAVPYEKLVEDAQPRLDKIP